jgi:VanZ family protein
MRRPEKSNLRAPIVLWTLGVTLALLAPVPLGLENETLHGFVHLQLDKLVHAALFFGLAQAWLRGAAGAPRAGVTLGLAVAAGLYGGLLELVQPSFGREAEWGDFAADLVGALVSWLWLRRMTRQGRAL